MSEVPLYSSSMWSGPIRLHAGLVRVNATGSRSLEESPVFVVAEQLVDVDVRVHLERSLGAVVVDLEHEECVVFVGLCSAHPDCRLETSRSTSVRQR